jgi:hypothetical protein
MSYNHVDSFSSFTKAQYSALIQDNATIGCLQEHQVIGPLPN